MYFFLGFVFCMEHVLCSVRNHFIEILLSACSVHACTIAAAATVVHSLRCEQHAVVADTGFAGAICTLFTAAAAGAYIRMCLEQLVIVIQKSARARAIEQ